MSGAVDWTTSLVVVDDVPPEVTTMVAFVSVVAAVRSSVPTDAEAKPVFVYTVYLMPLFGMLVAL